MELRVPGNEGGDAADPHVCFFLIICAKLLNAKVVVEAGTYLGYTATTLGKNLPDATIYTADIHDRDTTGWPPNVKFFHGRFEKMLETISEPLDLAFIDASEPSTEDCPRLEYLDLALSKMRKGGIAVVDDTAAVDWPHVNEIRARGDLVFSNYHGITVIQKR